MKKLKKIKKTLFLFFTILEIIILGIPIHFVRAGILDVEVVDFNDALRDSIHNVFGIDDKSLRNLTEQVNLIDGKESEPWVNIEFQDLGNGKKKAKAVANGIANLDQAYYIWYIVKDGEDPTDPNVINEAKKRAIQENVKNNTGFNPLVYDQTLNKKKGNGNGVIDGDEWPDRTFNVSKVYFGGENNRIKDPYLYMWGYGRFHELGEADEIDFSECYDDPSTANDEHCPGPEDGRNYGSDTGFHHYHPNPSTDPNESGTIPYSLLVLCPGSPNITECDNGFSYRGMETDNRIMFHRGLGQNLGEQFTVTCRTDTGSSYKYTINNSSNEDEGDYNIVYGTCDFSELAFNCNAGIPGESNCELDYTDEDDYEPYQDDDMHLFPKDDAGNLIGLEDTLSSDTKLEFGMSPIAMSTVPGILDIDLIRGKGISELTWSYESGDRIGVVVEGLSSIPTPHYDYEENEGGGYMPIFAFMSSGCELKKRGAYKTIVKGKEIEVWTSAMDIDDINECLADNLVEPGESDSSALNIELSSNWNGLPVPNESGSLLNVNYLVKDDSNQLMRMEQLNSQWNITCSKDGSTSVCGEGVDITQEMRESGSLLSKTKGNNLNKFSVLTNFPQSCFNDEGNGHVCITAKVSANSSGDTIKFGSKSLVMPIQKSAERIRAYIAKGKNGELEDGEEICSDSRNYSYCRVYQGEIIKFMVDNISNDENEEFFSWFVNGKSYNNCNSDKSNECYFPITDQVGEILNVSYIYNDPRSDKNYAGKKSLRSFIVKEPIFAIQSDNYETKGVYNTPEGKSFEEKSKSIISYSEDSLSLDLSIPRASGSFNWEWTVNNEKILNQKTVSFKPTSSNVKVRGYYRVPEEDKVVLEKKFGVDPYSFSDVYFSADARLIKDKSLVAKDKQNSFFATTANNTPVYFFFLLKTFLLVSIMIFISNLVFSLANYGRRGR